MNIGIFNTPYATAYSAGASSAADVIDWDLTVTAWADEYGIAEAFFAEHYTIGYEPSPAPDLMIAAAARLTKDIRLGAAAHLLPYHNPISLAHRLLWLDHMTKGRYIAGFAPGSFPTDMQLFATDGANADMMAEALGIVEAIWTREPPFRIAGEHWTADMPAYTEQWGGPHLKPFQRPHPEVIISGIQPQSPSFKQAGARGFSPMSQQVSAQVLREQWDTYAAAAAAAGHEPDRGTWRVVRDMFVAETDEEARRLVLEGPAGQTWDSHVLPAFKRIRARGNSKPYALGQLMLDPGMHIDELTVEWLVDNFWLVGSPETVVEKATALNAELGGCGTLVTQVFNYSATAEVYRRNLELLGREVAPRLEAATTQAAPVA